MAAAKTVVANDGALKNLVAKVDHIVVLMMENRSFDHMLGFLTIDEGRSDVEGLGAGRSNSVGGVTYPIHPATSTQLVKAQDPSHGSQSVAAQIAGGKMSRFRPKLRRDPAASALPRRLAAGCDGLPHRQTAADLRLPRRPVLCL